MRSSKYRRRGFQVRPWVALLLVFACFLSQAMPWPSHGHDHGQGPAVGEAAAAAIPVPQARETCSHHPEGCPPDCLCPKDPMDAGAAASDFPTGPTLTRCAGKALSDAPAPYGVFLSEASLGVPRPDPFEYLILPAPSRPQPGYRAETGKIPIG